jgi:hypothetical protein
MAACSFPATPGWPTAASSRTKLAEWISDQPAVESAIVVRGQEQFQEKCDTVFRPELRKNKELERFVVSMKR